MENRTNPRRIQQFQTDTISDLERKLFYHNGFAKDILADMKTITAGNNETFTITPTLVRIFMSAFSEEIASVCARMLFDMPLQRVLAELKITPTFDPLFRSLKSCTSSNVRFSSVKELPEDTIPEMDLFIKMEQTLGKALQFDDKSIINFEVPKLTTVLPSVTYIGADINQQDVKFLAELGLHVVPVSKKEAIDILTHSHYYVDEIIDCGWWYCIKANKG